MLLNVVVKKAANALAFNNSLNKLTFSKDRRIRRTDEFKHVFRTHQRLVMPYFTVHYSPNSLLNPRLGVVCSKRTAKLATDRNQLRRWVKETFRQHQKTLKNMDFVVIIRENAVNAKKEAFQTCLEQLFAGSNRFQKS